MTTKRFFCLLLAFLMLVSFAACGKKKPAEPEAPDTPETPEEATPLPDDGSDEPEPPEEVSGLPAVGETVEGFTVTAVREFPIAGGSVYLFEHDRTGAQLMFIANNDTNRVFDLTFFTRAIDNTGLPHVFEHSTLDGSEKYPSKALFFNLSYQTYSTYMNAETMPLLTTYPVASLSEAQLLKYADFYTDSCLHPMVLEDEEIFLEEAWRYRMADADSPLTIEGTVYSEMQGVLNLQASAFANMNRLAFPGSTIGNEEGGEPASIPDMSWQDLIDYHATYYHPSNCMAFLYGQFEDYTAFLKLLDDAFAPYDRQEYVFEDSGYEPITEPVSEKVAFPLEAGSNTDNISSVYYAIVCPGLKDSPEEELLLNTLTDILISPASPLMQKLGRNFATGDFSTFIDLDAPDDAILFCADSIGEDDGELFKRLVDEVLADIAENGFSSDLAESVTAEQSMSTRLMSEGEDVGVNLIRNIASCCAATGDPFNYMDYAESLEKLAEWNEQGLYRDAVSKWLVNSRTTALSTTYPEAGLREELDAAEAERLAGIKGSMSQEELQTIIDRSNRENEDDDASAYVSALQAVTVDSLPEEIRLYETSRTDGSDGVCYINAEADVDDVNHIAILLDTSGLSQEELHWLSLYIAEVGGLDTSRRSQEDLAVLATRHLYNWSVRAAVPEEDADGTIHPRLRIEWLCPDEDLSTCYDLVYEALFETEFTDYDAMMGQLYNEMSSLRSYITNYPYSEMLYRLIGADSPSYRYYSYLTGIEFYSFLEDAEQLMWDDPDAVAAKLEDIQMKLKNRTNAVVLCAGSRDGISANAAVAPSFMEKLSSDPIEPVSYLFPDPAKNEGLIVDSTVQFNGIVSHVSRLGLDSYSGDLDAVSSVLSDMYLYPLLRDQYGAYGVLAGFMEDGGAYLLSYRDPNVRETFAVFEDLPGFLREIDLDQETLDGYILSSYSYLAMPAGELSGAISAALTEFLGGSQEEVLDYMRDLKSLTLEDLKSYADVYDTMIEEGSRFTAGSASAINACADLYDAILNPFESVDPSTVELVDVPEGHRHYDAVRFVYEYYLMDPLTDDTFGVDERATVGAMCGALYSLLGEDVSAQQEALEFFQYYGIVPSAAKTDTALTGSLADHILASFSSAVDLDYASDPSLADNYDDLTRGELAEIITSYTLPLLEE